CTAFYADGILACLVYDVLFFSSRRRHTRSKRDWSSDVCSSDLAASSMKDEYISVEHLLLGLLDHPDAGLKELFRTYNVTREKVKIGRASCRERGEKGGVAGVGETSTKE